MKYVILENIVTGSRFFTMNGEDNTKIHDGTVVYAEIGFANTVKEAQIMLYGFSSTTCED